MVFDHNNIKDTFVCRLHGYSTQKFFQLTLIGKILEYGNYMFHNIIKQRKDIT